MLYFSPWVLNCSSVYGDTGLAHQIPVVGALKKRSYCSVYQTNPWWKVERTDSWALYLENKSSLLTWRPTGKPRLPARHNKTDMSVRSLQPSSRGFENWQVLPGAGTHMRLQPERWQWACITESTRGPPSPLVACSTEAVQPWYGRGCSLWKLQLGQL